MRSTQSGAMQPVSTPTCSRAIGGPSVRALQGMRRSSQARAYRRECLNLIPARPTGRWFGRNGCASGRGMSDFASRSFWLEDPYTPGPALDGDCSVDVAIVGGGFTGLWTAYFLKRAEPALRIAVVEQEVVGYGASGRNGGFAMTLLNRGLHDMVRAFGDDATRAAHRAAAASVDGIGAFTREHRVECHYEKNGLLCVASDPTQIPRIEAEYHDAERLGLAG